MVLVAKSTWWRTSKLLPATEDLRGIAATGTSWIIVGEDSGTPKIYTIPTDDTELVNPTYTARTPSGTDALYDVAHLQGENRTAACGLNGVIEYSSDKGATWNHINLGTGPDLYGITGRDGDALSKFVAAGDGEIWGANSAGTWTQRRSGPRVWRSITNRSTLGWCAVGNDGYATHSSNAVVGNWTTAYLATDVTLRDIASNDNYFMAVGNDGRVIRSATGLSGSWTQLETLTSGGLATVHQLAATGSWVIFSLSGRSWVSDDEGATWTENDYQIADQIFGLENAPDRMLSCGDNGGIYVSYDQTQENYVSTVETPTPPAAFTANADMAGDAVRRLVTQFRSGS